MTEAKELKIQSLHIALSIAKKTDSADSLIKDAEKIHQWLKK
jgi:hypothetical protein